MEKFIELIQAMPFWGWIAIIGVAGGVVVVAIEGYLRLRRMQIKHEERMAKIKQGIDPGDENEAYKKDEL